MNDAANPASRADKKPFLTDVQTLRERARQHLSGTNATQSYKGDVKQTIEILQTVLATEIVCVLRYTMHSVAATGISSEAVKEEFAEHAKEERRTSTPRAWPAAPPRNMPRARTWST